MIRQVALLYFFVFSIPVLLSLTAWQSSRYDALNRETKRLEAVQEEWVENNKRIIANIAVLSSAARIGNIAARELGLEKVQPENVLQITIERKQGTGNGE